LSKEKFVVDTILDLVEGKYVTHERKISELNSKDYGLSRATAWRVMKELEKCGYVEKALFHLGVEGWEGFGSKQWRLTRQLKERLAQIQIERTEAFWRDLDSILTFNDKKFEAEIRRRVYKLLGKGDVFEQKG